MMDFPCEHVWYSFHCSSAWLVGVGGWGDTLVLYNSVRLPGSQPYLPDNLRQRSGWINIFQPAYRLLLCVSVCLCMMKSIFFLLGLPAVMWTQEYSVYKQRGYTVRIEGSIEEGFVSLERRPSSRQRIAKFKNWTSSMLTYYYINV